MNTSGDPTAAEALQHPNCGCIYVAYGFVYWMYAVHSALTLRATNQALRAVLVTNLDLPNPVIDGQPLFERLIHHRAEDGANRVDKLSVDLLSPFEKTVYLDCDTEIWADLSPMFRLLDNYDMALRQLNVVTTKQYEILPGLTAHQAGFAEWNAGVIFFRKTRTTHAVFSRWREIFLDEGMKKDQPSFARAVLAHPELRLLPMSPAWNIKPTPAYEVDWIDLRSGDIRILHYRKPFTMPSVAMGINRSFELVYGSIRAGAEKCEDGIERFRHQYRALSIYLRWFDSPAGRRLLHNNEHLALLPLRMWLRLRAFFGFSPYLKFGRIQSENGANFRRETREG